MDDDKGRPRNSTGSRSRSGRRWPWIIGGITIVALLLVATVFWWIPAGVLSDGNVQEQGIATAYVDGANYLSGCENQARVSANIATAHADQLNRLITNAVTDTLGKNQGPGALDLNTTAGKQGFLTAFVQAYPNTTGLDKMFEDVLATVNGCQAEFTGKQSLVQDRVRSFNVWRTGSWWVRTFGGDQFPNDAFEIDLPGQPPVKGVEAYNKAKTPLLNSSVIQTYQNGTYNPTGPFDTSAPAVTPTR